MAIVSTVLAVFLNTAAIERLGAARTAMVGTLGPIATIALAAMVLGEPLSLVQLAGAALVILGVSQVGGRGRSPEPLTSPSVATAEPMAVDDPRDHAEDPRDHTDK